MPQRITSVHNEKVKECARLDKRSERDRLRVTRVEGLREVTQALEAGIVPVESFVCPDHLVDAESRAAAAELDRLEREHRTHVFDVTPEVFARLAVREGSGGIVLVIPYIERSLEQLPLRDAPFLCVVEGVEKPGNLGAILRTADAAGVDGVIVNEGATDLHNPNVIRASLGAFFSVPTCDAPAERTAAYLREHGIQAIAAHPDASGLYTEADLRGAVAIVMGSEAKGLSQFWRSHADALVRIPMHGRVDSLNLATATALLLYEVVRQRQINPG